MNAYHERSRPYLARRRPSTKGRAVDVHDPTVNFGLDFDENADPPNAPLLPFFRRSRPRPRRSDEVPGPEEGDRG